MNSLDLDRAAQTFAEATDLTVGVEEEFAILDPHTLDLLPRFEQLRSVAADDEILAPSIAGELIKSEIEIISGTGADLHDALARQRERRRRLFALNQLQERIAAEINRTLVGGTQEVLVEQLGRKGGVLGRTRTNKIVTFEGGAELIGRTMPVEIVESGSWVLHGRAARVPV